jgi:hypothetical protein
MIGGVARTGICWMMSVGLESVSRIKNASGSVRGQRNKRFATPQAFANSSLAPAFAVSPAPQTLGNQRLAALPPHSPLQTRIINWR